EIRARVDWALQAVDMQSYAQHPMHALSGGQKQRVAIAGLLALKPRAMVLDEPTAMLDPRGRREVLETLLQLHRREGITVVLVTHHVEEAVHAHRVVLLEQGQVCREGAAREVLADSRGLQALGVEPLPVPLLIQALAARGIDVPGNVLQPSELVEWLCR
ncbi:MAG: ATP-binding cassette domain-containing protein, partial [Syntrophomonadaceae bacterium]|nr:ATP-binding cassette domain-containing protein [Syntrophomonadaceae bacterium]